MANRKSKTAKSPSFPEERFRSEHFQQAFIGFGKLQGAQFLHAGPAECRTAPRLGFVLLPGATKEAQVDGLFRVGVRDRLHQFAYLHFDAEFLLEFAAQALFKRLLWLTFASRKLPQPGQMASRGTLGDEKFASAQNQGGGDLDDWCHGVYRLVLND